LFVHHHSDCTHCIDPDISGKKVSMLFLQSYEFIGWKHWKRNKEISWLGGKESSLIDERARGSSERWHFHETADTLAHDALQSICMCLL
jgi:hypothetical protein